jgi:hypothetical protein
VPNQRPAPTSDQGLPIVGGGSPELQCDNVLRAALRQQERDAVRLAELSQLIAEYYHALTPEDRYRVVARISTRLRCPHPSPTL